MAHDILFQTDDFVFSYRVAGLLIVNNKVLLQRTPEDPGYSIPGGHVAFGERSRDTLVRELKEEIGVDVEVNDLKWVGEIFFPWGKKPCHQIGLFYSVSLLGNPSIPLEGTFFGVEEIENQSFQLEFSWIDLKDIASIELYPIDAKALLLNGSDQVAHFVYREDIL